MIIKILKQVYNSPDDYAVRTPINELICKIATFSGGYYLYNKIGDQIAQITFEGNTAYLSVSSNAPTFPGAIKLIYGGNNQFVFATKELDRGDEQLLATIKTKVAKEDYNLRGDPEGYSYDIYNGNKVFANIVPSSTEKGYYLIRTNNDANILKIILISLAIDYLSTTCVIKK